MFIPILQLLPGPPNFVCSCSQHHTTPPLLFKPIGLVLGVGLALECYWFIRVTPLKKMGLLSPSSNQITSFLARSRLHAHLLYSTLRFCLAWVCASLVHVSSCVPLPRCVQNTLSHWSHLPPLTVFYSCCWESPWPLREGVCYRNAPFGAEHCGVSCFLHLDQFWVSVNWHILQEGASLWGFRKV